MGTSAKNRGSSSSSVLVPSWLEEPSLDSVPALPASENPPQDSESPDNAPTPQTGEGVPAPLPPLPAQGVGDRFRSSRIFFNRAIRTGDVRENLGRSLSGYSRRSMGSSGTAARRMRNSSQGAGRILGFAQEVRDAGFVQAAEEFGIGDLSGRPLGEVVSRLTEAFCEPGGGIDEAITRVAWNETLLQAIQQGVEDFETLTADQWTSLVETFIAVSIELRVFNDIGNESIGSASSVEQIDDIQAELHDLVFGAVQGKLAPIVGGGNRLSNDELRVLAESTYQLAFAYLDALKEE